ncbi:MAG: dTMP kinase [Candidatus Pacebacteria bacterium]|nr:dTMP kinase [Candidatus Paceibacterota bacterium]
MKKGRWVVFEGLDGTGKDTMINKLQVDMKEKGLGFTVVKDPSPKTAIEIRNILLNKKDLENNTRLFLYLAARCELLYKEIVPALEDEKIVLCNRYDLSSYCYQGVYFSQEDIATASIIGKLDIIKPDIQIVMLNKRSFSEAEKKNIMDEYCDRFRYKITKQYLEVAKQNSNVKALWTDGKTTDEVYSEVKRLIFN